MGPHHVRSKAYPALPAPEPGKIKGDGEPAPVRRGLHCDLGDQVRQDEQSQSAKFLRAINTDHPRDGPGCLDARPPSLRTPS